MLAKLFTKKVCLVEKKRERKKSSDRVDSSPKAMLPNRAPLCSDAVTPLTRRNASSCNPPLSDIA